MGSEMCIRDRLRLAEHQLNIDIKDLYERTDREDSAKIYKKRVEESPLNDAEVVKPRSPWYRAIFE